MPLTFASHFLAGSLLSLLLPVCLLIALVVWYTVSVKRVPSSRSEQADPASLGVDPEAGPGGPAPGPAGGSGS